MPHRHLRFGRGLNTKEEEKWLSYCSLKQSVVTFLLCTKLCYAQRILAIILVNHNFHICKGGVHR